MSDGPIIDITSCMRFRSFPGTQGIKGEFRAASKIGNVGVHHGTIMLPHQQPAS